MCSVAVWHAAVPFDGADCGCDGDVAGALDAGGLDGVVAEGWLGWAGDAGPLTVAVTVTVGWASGWLEDAEPQAATSDVAATAPTSSATRRGRRDVPAVMTRLAAPVQPVVTVV
jgi:hypothetical protein